jgi:hypothetical protein
MSKFKFYLYNTFLLATWQNEIGFHDNCMEVANPFQCGKHIQMVNGWSYIIHGIYVSFGKRFDVILMSSFVIKSAFDLSKCNQTLINNSLFLIKMSCKLK